MGSLIRPKKASMSHGTPDRDEDRPPVQEASFDANQQPKDKDENYDTASLSRGGSSNEESSTNGQVQEEVRVVTQMSRHDTNRIRFLRVVVLILICAVAVTVIATTYRFLKDAEEEDFDNAFNQFGATLVSSGVEQQRATRLSFETLSAVVTSGMVAAGAKMPFYAPPDFEEYGRRVRVQSNMQILSVAKKAEPDELDAYIEWINPRYEEIIAESHRLSPGFTFKPEQYTPYVKKFVAGQPVPDNTSDVFYLQLHRTPPFPTYRAVNFNLASNKDNYDVYAAHEILRNETLYGLFKKLTRGALEREEHEVIHSLLPGQSADDHPHACVTYPVYEEVGKQDSKIVGMVQGCLSWDAPLRDLLPAEIEGLHVVLRNTCNQTNTYLIEGPEAYFIGVGDLHDPKYDDTRIDADFSELYTNPNVVNTPGHCIYSMTVYPTQDFEDTYVSRTPEIFAGIMAGTFFLMIVVFLLYDIMVQVRNRKLVENAAQSNAFVSSMFPSNIRDRLLPGGEEREDAANGGKKSKGYLLGRTSKGQIKSFLDGGKDAAGTKPIADLFLETTIMFADISGFTAWSSVREPSQVFVLLETIFSELDRLAKKRNVFKVETVGDCYVAVAGLPEPTKDHALIMARFACDTVKAVKHLVKKLELSLGPDTGDLGVRVGLHSGTVTAGVLRGDRARFQLFGDTVNTTARIEATGAPNRIHMSKETADLLREGGKEHWVQERQDLVVAKGKGTLQTFWLESEDTAAKNDPEDKDMWGFAEMADNKEDRLINWQVEIFTQLLKQVVARRDATAAASSNHGSSSSVAPAHWTQDPNKTCLDEVKEIITLPEFDAHAVKLQEDPEQVDLGQTVIGQLRAYISTIASMYRKNDFHSFEHACHVTMSVTKLLSRIVAPSDINYEDSSESEDSNSPDDGEKERKLASTLHDHTYGITSDPLTQLAMVFSALIHDVDHTGVPNTTLVKENVTLATMYRNKSVAEQNSIDLAWDLLQTDQYRDLRRCIHATEAEFDRFRQLVVQAVLATDIADKELKVLRNARWDKAFAEVLTEENPRDTVNRKATIVIEHLIQASDVSHTMQHWYVYRKWNENFFRECYQAYLDGRAETDPSENWYEGEMGFFDFYIIPLAKKLKLCGVFGVSSDEYLNYALKNRQEWEDRGQEVVAMMMQQFATGQGKEFFDDEPANRSVI